MSFKQLKRQFLSFFKKVNFVHFIAFILVLIWTLNFFSNSNYSIQKSNVSEVKNEIKNSISKEALNLFPKEVTQESVGSFQYLFSKFDLSVLREKKIKTVFRDWIKKYLIVYEIDWGLEMYLKIKDAISNSIIESWDEKSWVFEANNLWIYSFYYNDFEKRGTAYLTALIWWKVWAFEFPKERYEKWVKLFTESIVKSN